ncbi:MAG: hypothetical protein R3F62_31830, partial [Planctomycetota bacterium]
MDQELLERERAFRNDPSPETELRLAQAYLRGGQGDAAWDHYVACGLQDPGLDDLGHDLAAAEAPALAELPEWVNAQAAGGRGPVTFISVAPPEDEAFPPLGTFRFL